MKHPFSLEGKVALITGGGTGIGFDMAKCFVESGAKVVITGRREEVLKEAISELGDRAFYLVNDVSNTEQTAGLVKQIVEKFGRIDLVGE